MNFDDQPVGQHKKLEIPEFPPEEERAEPEPLPQPQEMGPLKSRLKSKNPKVRFEAFSELLKLFACEEHAAEAIAEHFHAFPKYLSDAHPGVQEKALEAFLIVLGRSSSDRLDAITEMMPIIVEKGCTSGKTVVKTKSVDCIMAIAEMENTQKPLHDLLIGYTSAKGIAPKVVAVGLQVLTQLLSAFGNQIFPIKDAIKSVASQATSSNLGIKTEAMNYFVESHRWIRDAVLPLMAGLKPAQQEELKKKFAEESGDVSATRFVKGRPVVVPDQKKSAGKDGKAVIDTYADAIEVSMLKKFGDSWCSDLLSCKKWSEKRDRLEELVKAVSVDKIKNEGFFELGQALKRLMNDSNIVVVNLALKAIGLLANGLRSHFATYAKQVFEAVIQKWKDKKTAAEAQKCMEHLAPALKFDDMADAIKEALADKSPQIKSRICSWLEATVFPHMKCSVGKPFSKAFVPILVKLTDDANSEVRDSALSCLGAIKAIFKDPGLAKVIQEMNQQKQEKILKTVESIVGDDQGEEEKKVPATKPPTAPRPNVAPPAAQTSDVVKAEPKAEAKAEAKVDAKVEEEKRALSKLPSTAPVIHLDIALMSKEDAIKTLGAVLPETLLQSITDIPELVRWIEENPDKSSLIVDAILIHLKEKLNSIRGISTLIAALEPTRAFAFEAVPLVFEEISESKSESCLESILNISDSIDPAFVLLVAIKHGYSTKQHLKSILRLCCKMLEGYGSQMLPSRDVIDFAKHCYVTHSANKLIKSASVECLGLTYSYFGAQAKGVICGELKDSVAKSVEAEISKVQLKLPREAAEVRRKVKGETERLHEEMKAKSDGSNIARTNIASQITPKILAGLTDPAIKQRQEAKDALDTILASANYKIQSAGLNNLMQSLKSRMSEPSKTLARGFLALVGNMAMAMGPGFKQHSKVLLPPLMYNLADKQAAIKTEALLSMNKIAEAIGAEGVISNIGPLLEKDNSDMRSELLRFITKNREALVKADPVALVSPLVQCMQDKSKEVRGVAEEAAAEVMQCVGYHHFAHTIQDLKPSVKASLKSVLEKYRNEGEIATSRKDCEEVKVPVPPIHKDKRSSPTRKNKAQHLISPQPQKGPQEYRRGVEKSDGGRKEEVQAEMTCSRSTNNLREKEEVISRKPSAAALLTGKRFDKSRQSPTKSTSSASSNLVLETVVLSILGNKEKRAEADKKIRWPVNEVREELMEKLKRGLKTVLHPTLYEYMFAGSFKKNLQAMSTLKSGVGSEFYAIADIVDLLFKWLTTKMVDTSNTAMTKATLELLQAMFSKFEENKYQMLDFEAASILPMLCERAGINNATFKAQVHDLIVSAGSFVHPSKVIGYLVSALDSKSQKTKHDVLGLIKKMMQKHTARIVLPRDSKIMGKMLGSGDKTVKGEIVEIACEMYRGKGEGVWGMLGTINDKDREMLKKRFQQVDQMKRYEGHGRDASEDMTRKPSLCTFDIPKQNTCDLTLPLTVKSSPEKMQPRNASVTQQAKSTVIRERNFNVTENFTSFIQTERNIPKLSDSPRKPDTSTKPPASLLNLTLKKPAMTPIARVMENMKTESLDECLEVLKGGDMYKRVDALVLLNEKITSRLEEEKANLLPKSSKIFEVFTEVLNDTFNKPPHDIPIRFVKYFMTVTNKLCGIKAILKEVEEKALFRLIEQLLTKLLYVGLDKLGDNSEGEFIIKIMNTAMLRLLENCNPTVLFKILIQLFSSYKGSTAQSERVETMKIPGLIIKCILKLTKVIDSLLPLLDVEQLLVCLHEYIQTNPILESKGNANDEIGTRMVKTIVNELSKSAGEKMWEYFKSVREHRQPDTHIKRWIASVVRSGPAPSESSAELKEIFKGLNSQATFHDAIKALSEYLDKHQGMELNVYFASCSKGFTEYVNSSLQKYRAQIKVVRADPPPDEPLSVSHSALSSSFGRAMKGSVQEERSSTSLDEYRAKMTQLKQKLNGSAARDQLNVTAYATCHAPAAAAAAAHVPSSTTATALSKINKFKAVLQSIPKKPS